ncbi:MAG TPA: ATP-binding protein [Solirubrobacteraceae bacterium]|nr:ATP-binding protein [Solirubrobacteraceae bacterium]
MSGASPSGGAGDGRDAAGSVESAGAAPADGAPLTLAELRSIDLFEGLDEAELERLAAVASVRTVAAGETIADDGGEPTAMQLLLDGEARVLMIEGGRAEPVGRQHAPTWMGAISVLTARPRAVRMQAETRCRVADVPAADFRALAQARPEVSTRVMRSVGPVASRMASIEQNRERLASLGTMAAGLAHELNNPAAAARRAASQLVEALEAIDSALRTFVAAGVERTEAEQLVALQQEAAAGAADAEALDALAAADAEEELLERLEELDVPEPWRLTEPLAAAGVDEGWLERVAQAAGPATGAALRWVAASVTAGRLSAELCSSTERMTALVGAVKSYAYMDRGDLVEVDLHEGIETTLTLLGHKLKHTEIAVRRDYDRTLPKLTVHGSELNQVWTNLLDNAIDALGERGTLAIATSRDGDCAVVEIADDGPGIPAELAARIFDPFFTTKDVGAGTGLGLATARRIVVDRHDGSLTLDSEPGRTVFRVRLPLTQNRGRDDRGRSDRERSTAAGDGTLGDDGLCENEIGEGSPT